MTAQGHLFHREKCIACGRCVSACPNDALTLYGKAMTVEEVLYDLLTDRDFYICSGGGIALSGGECTLQADFCLALLKRCKEEGLHTAVDTCGLTKQESFPILLRYGFYLFTTMPAPNTRPWG